VQPNKRQKLISYLSEKYIKSVVKKLKDKVEKPGWKVKFNS